MVTPKSSMRTSKSLTHLSHLNVPEPRSPSLSLQESKRAPNLQPHTNPSDPHLSVFKPSPTVMPTPPMPIRQRSPTSTTKTTAKRRARSQAPSSTSRLPKSHRNLTLNTQKASATQAVNTNHKIPKTPPPLSSPTVLTCPSCGMSQFLQLYANSQSTAVCQACLIKFKKKERRKERHKTTLTSFPSLLREDSNDSNSEHDGSHGAGISLYERVLGVMRGGSGGSNEWPSKWMSRPGSPHCSSASRRSSRSESEESLASLLSFGSRETEGTWYSNGEGAEA